MYLSVADPSNPGRAPSFSWDGPESCTLSLSLAQTVSPIPTVVKATHGNMDTGIYHGYDQPPTQSYSSPSTFNGALLSVHDRYGNEGAIAMPNHNESGHEENGLEPCQRPLHEEAPIDNVYSNNEILTATEDGGHLIHRGHGGAGLGGASSNGGGLGQVPSTSYGLAENTLHGASMTDAPWAEPLNLQEANPGNVISVIKWHRERLTTRRPTRYRKLPPSTYSTPSQLSRLRAA